MGSQRLLIILLVLTVLVGCGWSQQPYFGTLPPRSISDINVFCNKLLILVGVVRLFLGEENITIANFSMIAAREFHDKDIDGPGPDNSDPTDYSDADGQNDGLWCQSSLNESMIGTWYRPNGEVVSRVDASPLYSNNTPTGQIGLLRNRGISPTGNPPVFGYEGLYRCVIASEEGVDQTLYVAAYSNSEFGKDDGMFTFHLHTFYLFSLVKSFQSLMVSHSSSSHQLILILQCLVYHLMSLTDHLQL